VRKWGFQPFRIYLKKLSSHRNLWSIWPIHDATWNPWPIHDHADHADQKLKKPSRKAGASNRSLHVLEIHDQSTTMLTMLTKNEKIALERRCVEPSGHVLRRENLNKTRNHSNSRPQNGQIVRKHNEPKMANFPNTSISTGILNYYFITLIQLLYWKVSWLTLSNNSIFQEIP